MSKLTKSNVVNIAITQLNTFMAMTNVLIEMLINMALADVIFTYPPLFAIFLPLVWRD